MRRTTTSSASVAKLLYLAMTGGQITRHLLSKLKCTGHVKMKAFALIAAMVAVSSAQFGGFSSPSSTNIASALKGPLQNVPLATNEMSLPKCFPTCT